MKKQKIDSLSILPMAKEFMMRYGEATIENRALPDYRDGCKPVHRRLLYSAYIAGNNYNSPFTKSAKLVGFCMGSFHTQGDCLRGDTLVPLLNGKIVPISSLVGKSKKWVLAYDIENKKFVPALAHSWRIGQTTHKMYRVHLSTGEVIECTSNHPFLTKHNKWVKAENLKDLTELKGGSFDFTSFSYNVLYSKQITKSSNYIPLHRLIYSSLVSIDETDIIHHKNENKKDNRPNNLELEDRGSHASLHVNKSNLDALARGRKTQFNANSPIREIIAEKNSILMTEFNKTQPLRKAIKAVNILKERKLPLTEDNYNQLSSEIYNLTKLSTIKEKFNYSLKDLSKISRTWSMDLSNKLDNVRTKLNQVKAKNKLHKNRKVFYNKFIAPTLANTLLNIFKDLQFKDVSWNEYLSIAYKYAKDNKNKVLYANKQLLCKKFKIKKPIDLLHIIPADFGVFVVRVEKTFLKKKEDFYDFTVDNMHNMIVLSSKDNRQRKNFIVVHNSGIYGALGTLVNLPDSLFEGHGNWGSPDGDAPAASRYTECRLSKYSNNYLLDRNYMAVIPTVDNYDGTTTEPVYLPSKLPGVLITGAEGIAMGCTTLIPTFSRESVTDLVLQSLKSKKGCTAQMCVDTLKFKFSYGGEDNNSKETLLEYYKTGEGKLNFVPKVELTKKGHILISSLTPRLKPSQIYDTITEKEKSSIRDCKNIHGKGCSYWAELIPKGKLNQKELKELAKKIQNDYSTNLSCKTLVTERQDDGENVKFMCTNIPNIVNMWIKWRIDFEKKVVERLIRLEEEKKQKLLWLMWAIDNLELVFKALKSKDPDEFLIKKGKITEEHARYILDGVVRRLSKLSKTDTKEKIKVCENTIISYKKDISDSKSIAKRVYRDLQKI